MTQKKDGYIEGSSYIVSWCVGHLVEFVHADVYNENYAKWTYTDLPIIPPQWKLAVKKNTQKQFKVLSALMKDSRVTSLICATDAGREGELIFRLVYEKADCKKPFERLWISSMEDVAIQKGFENLQNGHDFDNLYASALCRAKADWLVGINATRLFSILYNHKLNVGRVQSPTLALLTERQHKIKNFQPQKYFQVSIDCGTFSLLSKRFEEKETAQKVQSLCDGNTAKVLSVLKENKTSQPPKLYDLTTLQREANRFFGYTAQQTLDLVQTLYEKKLCTYPRTDSRFLTEDMEKSTLTLLSILLEKMDFAKELDVNPSVERIMNNKKVSDHHAIIPTPEVANISLDELSKSEQNILSLISYKLLAAVSDPQIFESVRIEVSCMDQLFVGTGNSILVGGWKVIENRFKRFLKTETSKDVSVPTLPPLAEGEVFENIKSTLFEKVTTPPKPYTEDTLLSQMEKAGNDEVELSKDAEKKGLGTPATRAATIEKLLSSGFVERKNKTLLPTEHGSLLISILPSTLTSAKLTAQWENELTLIAKGERSEQSFMEEIEQLIKNLCESVPKQIDDKVTLFHVEQEAIGNCPRCSSRVLEGKKNFYCENKDCQFVLWKENKFFTNKKKTLTKPIAKDLLTQGQTFVKGLYSEKTGKKYNAVILLDDTGEKYVNFKLSFEK